MNRADEITAAHIRADKEVERLRAEKEALLRALETISEWSPETFPRVPDRHNPGETISYGFAYGSNGERDFMRDIAAAAIERVRAKTKGAKP